MLITIGWTAAEYGFTARQALTASVAGLCAEPAFTGCLAALPTETQDRSWLLSFLSSLKRVASIQTVALLSASSMSTSDLIACDAEGVDEVIILQDCCDPSRAIAMVQNYRHARTLATMRIRVWLDEVVRSGFQAQITAWMHGTEMFANVERSPFCAEESSKDSSARPGEAQPLACEWVESAFTMTASGAVVACPAHIVQAAVHNPATSTQELLERQGTLQRSAGSHPTCRSCHRHARFMGADVLGSPALTPPLLQQYPATDQRYQDHIRCSGAELPEPEQEAALAGLALRIRVLDGGRS